MGPDKRVVVVIRDYFARSKLPLSDVRAVYLWGSVLRSDFDPALSDVDCIAISGSHTDESELHELRDYARISHKELERLNIRCLYLSDFNYPTPQSELARVIDPRLLLADFPSWILIWGQRISLSSFALGPCNLQEAFTIRLRTLKDRMRRYQSIPRSEAAAYVMKEAGYISHLIHQLNEGIHPFTYTQLEKRSNCLTAPLTRAIIALRSQGWPEAGCEQAIPLILRFLKEIEVSGRFRLE